jgi:hypothetical protein
VQGGGVCVEVRVCQESKQNFISRGTADMGVQAYSNSQHLVWSHARTHMPNLAC